MSSDLPNRPRGGRATRPHGWTGFEVGCELHPIQLRAALATPSHWVDAIVERVEEDGWLRLVDLSGASWRAWHHESLGERVTAGEPVALHRVYGVLSVGRDHLSVRIAAPVATTD